MSAMKRSRSEEGATPTDAPAAGSDAHYAGLVETAEKDYAALMSIASKAQVRDDAAAAHAAGTAQALTALHKGHTDVMVAAECATVAAVSNAAEAARHRAVITAIEAAESVPAATADDDADATAKATPKLSARLQQIKHRSQQKTNAALTALSRPAELAVATTRGAVEAAQASRDAAAEHVATAARLVAQTQRAAHEERAATATAVHTARAEEQRWRASAETADATSYGHRAEAAALLGVVDQLARIAGDAPKVHAENNRLRMQVRRLEAAVPASTVAACQLPADYVAPRCLKECATAPSKDQPFFVGFGSNDELTSTAPPAILRGKAVDLWALRVKDHQDVSLSDIVQQWVDLGDDLSEAKESVAKLEKEKKAMERAVIAADARIKTEILRREAAEEARNELVRARVETATAGVHYVHPLPAAGAGAGGGYIGDSAVSAAAFRGQLTKTTPVSLIPDKHAVAAAGGQLVGHASAQAASHHALEEIRQLQLRIADSETKHAGAVVALQTTRRDLSDARERVVTLEVENAKLTEDVAGVSVAPQIAQLQRHYVSDLQRLREAFQRERHSRLSFEQKSKDLEESAARTAAGVQQVEQLVRALKADKERIATARSRADTELMKQREECAVLRQQLADAQQRTTDAQRTIASFRASGGSDITRALAASSVKGTTLGDVVVPRPSPEGGVPSGAGKLEAIRVFEEVVVCVKDIAAAVSAVQKKHEDVLPTARSVAEQSQAAAVAQKCASTMAVSAKNALETASAVQMECIARGVADAQLVTDLTAEVEALVVEQKELSKRATLAEALLERAAVTVSESVLERPLPEADLDIDATKLTAQLEEAEQRRLEVEELLIVLKDQVTVKDAEIETLKRDLTVADSAVQYERENVKLHGDREAQLQAALVYATATIEKCTADAKTRVEQMQERDAAFAEARGTVSKLAALQESLAAWAADVNDAVDAAVARATAEAEAAAAAAVPRTKTITVTSTRKVLKTIKKTVKVMRKKQPVEPTPVDEDAEVAATTENAATATATSDAPATADAEAPAAATAAVDEDPIIEEPEVTEPTVSRKGSRARSKSKSKAKSKARSASRAASVAKSADAAPETIEPTATAADAVVDEDATVPPTVPTEPVEEITQNDAAPEPIAPAAPVAPASVEDEYEEVEEEIEEEVEVDEEFEEQVEVPDEDGDDEDASVATVAQDGETVAFDAAAVLAKIAEVAEIARSDPTTEDLALAKVEASTKEVAATFAELAAKHQVFIDTLASSRDNVTRNVDAAIEEAAAEKAGRLREKLKLKKRRLTSDGAAAVGEDNDKDEDSEVELEERADRFNIDAKVKAIWEYVESMPIEHRVIVVPNTETVAAEAAATIAGAATTDAPTADAADADAAAPADGATEAPAMPTGGSSSGSFSSPFATQGSSGSSTAETEAKIRARLQQELSAANEKEKASAVEAAVTVARLEAGDEATKAKAKAEDALNRAKAAEQALQALLKEKEATAQQVRALEGKVTEQQEMDEKQKKLLQLYQAKVTKLEEEKKAAKAAA